MMDKQLGILVETDIKNTFSSDQHLFQGSDAYLAYFQTKGCSKLEEFSLYKLS